MLNDYSFISGRFCCNNTIRPMLNGNPHQSLWWNRNFDSACQKWKSFFVNICQQLKFYWIDRTRCRLSIWIRPLFQPPCCHRRRHRFNASQHPQLPFPLNTCIASNLFFILCSHLNSNCMRKTFLAAVVAALSSPLLSWLGLTHGCASLLHTFFNFLTRYNIFFSLLSLLFYLSETWSMKEGWSRRRKGAETLNVYVLPWCR